MKASVIVPPNQGGEDPDITLRDLLAIIAMHGILSYGGRGIDVVPIAYEVADQMILGSNAKPNGAA